MKTKKKIIIVREHPLHAPVSKKNPTGMTIRDHHLRRLPGTYLDPEEINSIFKNYDRKGIVYPSKKRLTEYYKEADKYDELIAVWTDYFNKKFNSNPLLDPDVVKALIASESGFRLDPKENKIAFGIAQITKSTFKILLDPGGETKDFIFKKIRQKDLKDPSIAIPLAVRWLHRKKTIAKSKLGKEPNHEEIILEYKGMLKSKTDLKKKALGNYKERYEKLKTKDK